MKRIKIIYGTECTKYEPNVIIFDNMDDASAMYDCLEAEFLDSGCPYFLRLVNDERTERIALEYLEKFRNQMTAVL